MMNWKEFGRKPRGLLLRNSPRIYVEGLRKNTKNLSG
jgi:hypothetical protein